MLSMSALLGLVGASVLAVVTPMPALASSHTAPNRVMALRTSPVATGGWGNAEQVPGIASLEAGGGSYIDSLSCASTGNCAAGGLYTGGAFVVNETNGTWGDAQQVSGIGDNAEIFSVSCASAGNCAAGGFYSNGSPLTFQPFVVDETDGAWGTAEEVPGIAILNVENDGDTQSVSCASPGNCAAGGFYRDSSDEYQAFVVSEKNGTWGNAEQVPGTATLNAGGDAQIVSLSCASASNCAAGGSFTDTSGNGHDFVVNETKGTWADAEEVPGTAGGGYGTRSVSCTSARDCTAIGESYLGNSGHQRDFVVTETKGTWADAEKVPGLGRLNTGRGSLFSQLSCSSTGNCAAGGYYDTESPPSSIEEAFIVNETNGTWANAEEVPGTAALNASGLGAGVSSVSCASAGNCAIAGYYDACTSGDDNCSQVFVANEMNGKWRDAEEVPGTATLNAGDDDYIRSVSCAPAGSCAAGGFYTDSSGNKQAFVVNSR